MHVQNEMRVIAGAKTFSLRCKDASATMCRLTGSILFERSIARVEPHQEARIWHFLGVFFVCHVRSRLVRQLARRTLAPSLTRITRRLFVLSHRIRLAHLHAPFPT